MKARSQGQSPDTQPFHIRIYASFPPYSDHLPCDYTIDFDNAVDNDHTLLIPENKGI
jgi:hypothetical protein